MAIPRTGSEPTSRLSALKRGRCDRARDCSTNTSSPPPSDLAPKPSAPSWDDVATSSARSSPERSGHRPAPPQNFSSPSMYPLKPVPPPRRPREHASSTCPTSTFASALFAGLDHHLKTITAAFVPPTPPPSPTPSPAASPDPPRRRRPFVVLLESASPSPPPAPRKSYHRKRAASPVDPRRPIGSEGTRGRTREVRVLWRSKVVESEEEVAGRARDAPVSAGRGRGTRDILEWRKELQESNI